MHDSSDKFNANAPHCISAREPLDAQDRGRLLRLVHRCLFVDIVVGLVLFIVLS